MFIDLNCYDIKPGTYEINEEGIIRNKSSGHIMSVFLTAGYPSVRLDSICGKRKTYYIHRLVGMMYIPNQNPEINNFIHHKDFDKQNYSISNIEWVDQKTNNKLGGNGLIEPPWKINLNNTSWGDAKTTGKRNGMNKYPEEMIRKICEGLKNGLSHRECARLVGLPDTDTSRLYVTLIKNKKRWKSISDEYF